MHPIPTLLSFVVVSYRPILPTFFRIASIIALQSYGSTVLRGLCTNWSRNTAKNRCYIRNKTRHGNTVCIHSYPTLNKSYLILSYIFIDVLHTLRTMTHDRVVADALAAPSRQGICNNHAGLLRSVSWLCALCQLKNYLQLSQYVGCWWLGDS